MIPIKQYREMIEEIAVNINNAADDTDKKKIDGVILAVQEDQLIKKLKDKKGTFLAGNVPGAKITNDGYIESKGKGLLFLIRKIAAGSESDEKEMNTFQDLQDIAREVIKWIMEPGSYMCDNYIEKAEQIQVEWEYNIYGGWNGLSISFNLKDTNE